MSRKLDRKKRPFCPRTPSDCPFFNKILQISEDVSALKANMQWNNRLSFAIMSILVLILIALVV